MAHFSMPFWSFQFSIFYSQTNEGNMELSMWNTILHWECVKAESLTRYSKTSVRLLSVWTMSCRVTMLECLRSFNNDTAETKNRKMFISEKHLMPLFSAVHLMLLIHIIWKVCLFWYRLYFLYFDHYWSPTIRQILLYYFCKSSSFIKIEDDYLL